MEPNINCYKCKYFYITWDKNFPYGCKAMKFKTKKLPSKVVKENSNMTCQSFIKKIKSKDF